MKLGFICGPNDSFLKDIIKYFSGVFEVRMFQGITEQEMSEFMNWCDVCWFEWCDQLLVAGSRLPKVCKIICRLHAYEAFNFIAGKVNWANVDELIYVAPHVQKIVERQYPELEKVSSHIVYNGVDLDKFKFRDRKPGFDIAYVGNINQKKNPSLLLQCMQQLQEIDQRYMLHVAGAHEDLRWQLYWDKMVHEMGLNVKMSGWVKDIETWLDSKQYIITTSPFESFGYGVAEAMTCGLKPLIHNFVGAKYLYPKDLTFNTIDECLSLVTGKYDSGKYRRWIANNYGLNKQLKELKEILETT